MADGGLGRWSASPARCCPRHARGRLGRVPLAVACGVAGLAYGAVLNLSTWVDVHGRPHARRAYGAIAGAALPVRRRPRGRQRRLRLAFGPALLRALARFRAALRGHVARAARRSGRRARLALLLALLIAGARRARGRRPLDYLRARPELRRRLRGAPGQASPALHGLGGAGAGRRRAQPADVQARRTQRRSTTCARAEGPERHRRARAHDPRARAAAASARRLAGRDLVAELHAHARADGAFDGGVELDRVRRAGARGRRVAGDVGRPSPRRAVDRAPAEPRRRLQLLRRAAARQRRRRHGAARPGARGRRAPGRAVKRAVRVPAPRAEPRRRLPALARRGPPTRSPRPGRSRGSSPPAEPRPRPCAGEPRARWPTCARSPARRRALLAHERPDPGVGHRPGADGAGPQAAADRRRSRGPRRPRRRRSRPGPSSVARGTRALRACAAPTRGRGARGRHPHGCSVARAPGSGVALACADRRP